MLPRAVVVVLVAVAAGISLRCPDEADRPSLAAEWAHGVANGGMAATGAAIGAIIIIIMMSSSSAASAFRRGGAGVRIRGGTVIPTDITAMGIRTITTPTVATDMVTDSPAMEAMDIAMALNQGWPSCNGDSLAPATTMAPSMESWGPERDKRFGLTSATTDT